MAEYATARHDRERHLYQRIGFVFGPVAALLISLLPIPEGLSPEAWHVIAVAAWLASWWATEAIPVPATSLIPIVAFPMLGVMDTRSALVPYADPVVFLLLGGFIIAMSMQKWHLHRRIALTILARFGERPDALVMGFMVATAGLSMWVSNTATTLMMIPIAFSVAESVAGEDAKGKAFTIALVLSIPYAASIGGLGTVVGTPPNLLVRGFLTREFGEEISFIQWMTFGIPVVVLLVPAAWFVLTRWCYSVKGFSAKKGHDVILTELAELGRITTPERRTAILFLLIATAWVFRPLLQEIDLLSGLTDTGIAIGGAILMFLIPSGARPGKSLFLLDWETAVRIPWGVILLFGGGLSLARAVSSTGLAEWLGQTLHGLTAFPLVVLILALVTMIIFLTELTSNTATVAGLLPVLGAIATVGQIDPILLAAPAAMAGSCAFMLPVATAPNAIVFASGRVHIPDMVRAGFRLNLMGIAIITMVCYAVVPLVFGAG